MQTAAITSHRALTVSPRAVVERVKSANTAPAPMAAHSEEREAGDLSGME